MTLWVDLGCVARLPRTPVLLPSPRRFSGRSRGSSIEDPGPMINASLLLIIITPSSFYQMTAGASQRKGTSDNDSLPLQK